MAEKRDYYEVLGVQKNANADEIKKAYRKAARTAICRGSGFADCKVFA